MVSEPNLILDQVILLMDYLQPHDSHCNYLTLLNPLIRNTLSFFAFTLIKISSELSISSRNSIMLFLMMHNIIMLAPFFLITFISLFKK